ncbi:hypothetical protein GE061_012253 [Apolygus lucorum]|uniref:Uncharacterized protein n=1 Tax=Apolygus lucorum TaxID=248454 RepID=A0A8S9XU20_APOLU|nr:hypothetical protein GE061_012253 [Apolygus lucorum]
MALLLEHNMQNIYTSSRVVSEELGNPNRCEQPDSEKTDMELMCLTNACAGIDADCPGSGDESNEDRSELFQLSEASPEKPIELVAPRTLELRTIHGRHKTKKYKFKRRSEHGVKERMEKTLSNIQNGKGDTYHKLKQLMEVFYDAWTEAAKSMTPQDPNMILLMNVWIVTHTVSEKFHTKMNMENIDEISLKLRSITDACGDDPNCEEKGKSDDEKIISTHPNRVSKDAASHPLSVGQREVPTRKRGVFKGAGGYTKRRESIPKRLLKVLRRAKHRTTSFHKKMKHLINAFAELWSESLLFVTPKYPSRYEELIWTYFWDFFQILQDKMLLGVMILNPKALNDTKQ